ncbi:MULTISPECIES: class I SAM-dependent methyltransferase [Moorena]|uniref:Methylase involved in ubiquinone/menaquinone biosynthesis n=1 Tax=Moorena producens 3L TaxID=489825 RepID=F4XMB7_9CYAN|nr:MULTISPECIES: class I SAM-dependent methyltransferase [Moorena]EGJ33826.1 methylase involved in ubiquinone/menaquinone biosynthesis [Moorena producens 3L]NEP35398.1 methyltransferase domain-containing protein [Moorena sp. SIO3B2]NEP67878.1 methyltransferase domain-containing protein [Moorena sp. SIO3A5]OLT68992.1 methyltransferase [Moorena producens 3L]
MSKKTDTVHWVYSSQNNQELAERYDVWAKEYEQDLLPENYTGPEPAVEVLVKYLSKEAKILDAGAGTGLVGQVLHQRGYGNLEAMDISAGMLEEARKKNVYIALHQGILGEPLALATDTFDGIISVGTFTLGHAPSSGFDELIRITKPGGYIIFTIRPDYYQNSDFKDKQAALEAAGKWKLVEKGEPFANLPEAEPDIYLQVWAYKVC